MENDTEKNIEDSQDTEPRIETLNKGEFFSQSRFNDFRTQVAGMETQMAKLVVVLQDSTMFL